MLSDLEEKLKVALELHINILHAESQAISAKDLSTIESILPQKDESLSSLVSIREKFKSDPAEVPLLGSLIASVLDHQLKNTQKFKTLHKQDSYSGKSSHLSNNSLPNRLLKAYRPNS